MNEKVWTVLYEGIVRQYIPVPVFAGLIFKSSGRPTEQ